MKPLIKNLVYTILFMIIIFNLFSCKKLNNFRSFIDDKEDKEIDITINSDDESELMDAIELLNANEGIIFINTPVINLKKNSIINITGTIPRGIFGLKQDNGEFPRINFLNKNESNSGIHIYGSDLLLSDIIIENVHGDGISIFGNNNILDRVVSRYNYGSGIVVYGDYNTLNYCYSYKNCDANVNSVNADGFRIYGEIDNVFNHCFAWENANSGFNYVRNMNSSELSYIYCGSWNNGNINVFTGFYDYNLGNALDKNLWTIQEIIKSDSKFVNNFYNKKYNIDNAEIDGIPVKEWSAKVEPKMDGNGFTFGNKNGSQSIDVKRDAFYCVAFDNKYGGFIDNYNHKYNGYMTNCVAFSNYINYKLPYTFSKWENNWSWLSKESDQLNKVATQDPRDSDKLYNIYYSTRNNIVKAISQNMFPDKINFDELLKYLKEKKKLY